MNMNNLTVRVLSTLSLIVVWFGSCFAQVNPLLKSGTSNDADTPLLEPWVYSEDFEDRELGAWASYPLWQDIAYNQNFRVNEIIPGDTNISIVQKVTPYTAVDNYAGAQKLLNMYLIPGSTLKLRYYLKTNQSCDWIKVRFAGGPYGKLDVTLQPPVTNEWSWIEFSYQDLLNENPTLTANETIRIYALAVLAKFTKADPDMPIYLGLDDITLKGSRAAPFKFTEPSMHKLPEFEPYIPASSYRKGSEFKLSGEWGQEIEKVSLQVTPFNNPDQLVYQSDLSCEQDSWTLKPLPLDFSEGLYLVKLVGYGASGKVSETPFTIHIALSNMAGKHPRLLFDDAGKKILDQRFTEDRFQKLSNNIAARARDLRANIPVSSLQFDLDQFPDEDWLPTWDAWGSRIYHTGAALRLNARAYAFVGDQEAGDYVKQVLIKLSSWPNWTHPWQTKRGRYSEHRTGSWSHRVAEAYDLTYHLMTPDERSKVRTAIFENIIKGVHRTYVYNDNITAATSNWLAMTVGGSLMCQSAIFGDGKTNQPTEPYFTGAILKLNRFLQKVTDSQDGAWGEGFGYNNYSLSNLSYSLPSLENVFNIDLSEPLHGTYNEYIWAGLIKDKRWFEYGDSKGDLNSATNWAYLLDKSKAPRLSWFYHFLKGQNQAYEDVVFDVSEIPQQDPFNESPIKLFRNLGTTVFKSGWEKDDFVFVMRTGPAYNHQHLDQGSIWLADRGKIFVEERPLGNSHYYDDPIYESWLTQPVGHSTILINDNHQSQRVGDHLDFAPGFDDYAFVSHFLDGADASFTSGEIGRLYWGEVDGLCRNVLYLKPRTLLLLDVVTPSLKDAKATLLFQTERLADLQPGPKKSAILKDESSMHMFHLWPSSIEVEAVETPHYLRTLQNTRPLVREGMLTLSAVTKGEPLVIANLITTTAAHQDPAIDLNSGDNHITGTSSDKNFAINTKLGKLFSTENFSTDALAITWNQGRTFMAKATFYRDEQVTIRTEVPVTLEVTWANMQFKYYSTIENEITISGAITPSKVYLNGSSTDDYLYDEQSNTLKIRITSGEGAITIE